MALEADEAVFTDRIDADDDVVALAQSVKVSYPREHRVPRMLWGRLDATGHFTERSTFNPWEWDTDYAGNVFGWQVSAGRVALVGQFGVAVGVMAPPRTTPLPCDESSDACVDLAPGCGSPSLPSIGRYRTLCSPDSGSCHPGESCERLSVDGGLAGCDVPTWVCTLTGQSYPEVTQIPFKHTGSVENALLDGDFLFVNNVYVGTKGFDVRDKTPAEVNVDDAATGPFQRNSGHLTFTDTWLSFVLRRDIQVAADAPLAQQRYARVTGPGHGDALYLATSRSGDFLASGIASFGVAPRQANQWLRWNLLDAIGPLQWGTWLLRGADRDVAIRSGVDLQGWSAACHGFQGLAAIEIAEDGSRSSKFFCAPDMGTGSSTYVAAGDHLLFAPWQGQRMIAWDLASDDLAPLADVASHFGENDEVHIAVNDDASEVAHFAKVFEANSLRRSDVRIFSARPFSTTPIHTVQLTPEQANSSGVFKWSRRRLVAALDNGAVSLVFLDGAPSPPPLVLDATTTVHQIWLRDRRAFVSLRARDGSGSLVELAVGDDLREIGRLAFPSTPEGLLDVGDSVAVSTLSEFATLSPGCR